MKITTGLLLTALVSVPLGSIVAQEEVDYSLVPVSDNVIHFRGGTGGNHFGTVLVTDEGIVLSDTIDPESATWLRDELKKRYDVPVKYLVYTHGHYDHVGGSGIFKEDGAIIIAHENAESDLMANDAETQWVSKRNIAMPDITFSDKFTIRIGGKNVDLVYLGPGHSESLVAVHYVEDKVAHVVDVANIKQVGYRTLGKPVKQYIRQLKKARELDFDVIIPGHANIGGPEDLDIYIDYLTALVAQVEDAIAAGKSLEQTQKTIKMDKFKTLKRWDDWYLLNVQGVYEQLKEASES
jgi:glyoxylase-like metal-dependent hydrolase (beta-lactamase superfamily II)